MANPRGIGKREIKPLTQEQQDALDIFYLNRAVKMGAYKFDEDGTPKLVIPLLHSLLFRDQLGRAEAEADSVLRTLKNIGLKVDLDANGSRYRTVYEGGKQTWKPVDTDVTIFRNYDGPDQVHGLQTRYVCVDGYDALQKMADAGLELPAAEILGLEIKRSHAKSAKRGA